LPVVAADQSAQDIRSDLAVDGQDAAVGEDEVDLIVVMTAETTNNCGRFGHSLSKGVIGKIRVVSDEPCIPAGSGSLRRSMNDIAIPQRHLITEEP